MIDAAAAELRRGLAGGWPACCSRHRRSARRGAAAVAAARREGLRIRSATIGGQSAVIVAAESERGLLYGAFALLRHLDSGGSSSAIALQSAPRVKLRVVDHWDNLDGFVERGYSGSSLWDWWTLPDYRDPRYTDYARAEASLGINGVVLNNVNAKADSLTAAYIARAAALAEVFRPYGIKVYLSARFSSPRDIGGLATADPLDPAVRAWWVAKADEIYQAIPDFGGFLVKANSEGQPGPGDYGRTHADGANMLAAALAPHGGVVMWRAFVYSDTNPEDRAKQAYSEFKPLDGTFADNVLVQVKNGAIDFQPREPFHPLFGAMPQTPLMLELQITKEYLGQGTSLAYLGPMYAEVLNADTHVTAAGPTVAQVVDGSAEDHELSGIAGVSNVGRSRDWSGSTFNQANWYAFGGWRGTLASPEAIAREWAAQTFSPDPQVVEPVVRMMMGSREAVVNYTGALGLAHQMATGHHYGPGPWIADLARPEWNPAYYNRADATGSASTARHRQRCDRPVRPAARRAAGRPRTTPESDLLWFHHVPWSLSHHQRPAAVGGAGRALRRRCRLCRRDAPRVGRAAPADRCRALAEDRRFPRHRGARRALVARCQPGLLDERQRLAAARRRGAARHDLAWYKAQAFPYAPGNP
jgi:alpha-glucuronidase